MASTPLHGQQLPDALSKLLNSAEKNANKGPKFGKRHIQALAITSLMYMGFIIRTILSVSIVAMTNPSVNPNTDIPTYNWTDKSLVVGSFLWGYFIPQMAAGYLADRYGPKWFLISSISVTAVAGLLIPAAAATLGSKGVMICRFIQGLSQGFLYPSTSGLLGKWIPSTERSTIGTFVYSGAAIGIVSSMIFTGYISASRYGWPFAYYLFSIITLIVAAIYCYVGCNDPSEHSTITEEERTYIQSNLKTSTNRQQLNIPFKEMFTSSAFYALLITNIAFNYTHWTFITETSIYMDKVMKFDIKSNSLLTSLPYIVEVIVGFLACFVADFFTKRKILSITIIRRIMNNVGVVIPAIALYLLANTGPNDINLAVFLLILVSGMHGAGKSGHVVNHMDLAPNFSGVMMGITNGTAVFCSSMAPIITQFVVTDETDRGQWKIIFYLALGINVIATLINTFFTSGKLQPWSQGTSKEAESENIKIPV